MVPIRVAFMRRRAMGRVTIVRSLLNSTSSTSITRLTIATRRRVPTGITTYEFIRPTSWAPSYVVRVRALRSAVNSIVTWAVSTATTRPISKSLNMVVRHGRICLVSATHSPVRLHNLDENLFIAEVGQEYLDEL